MTLVDDDGSAFKYSRLWKLKSTANGEVEIAEMVLEAKRQLSTLFTSLNKDLWYFSYPNKMEAHPLRHKSYSANFRVGEMGEDRKKVVIEQI